MKQFLPKVIAAVAFSLFAANTAQAQQVVPNGTMENWVVRDGSDAPTRWQTTDDVLRLFATAPLSPTGSVLKSADFHGGSFAAQLTNKRLPQGSVPGFMALGDGLTKFTSIVSLVQLGGVPYTSRPARMQLYYKFAGTINSPDDRPLVLIELTTTTGGTRRVVATGRQYLPPAASYTLIDFPLSYKLGMAPDSIHIAIGSADFDGGAFTAGNTLFVDDIALTGTVTATRDAQLQAAVEAYPNPSTSGLFTLASTQENALLAAPLVVTDALGRVVLRQTDGPAATHTVDLRQQPAGVYTLTLDTPRGQLVKKLIIR